MCEIGLEGITIFVYLAAWSVVVSYVGCTLKGLIMPLLGVLCVAAMLVVQIESTCSIAYVKWGAATEAVLLFVLFRQFVRHGQSSGK